MYTPEKVPEHCIYDGFCHPLLRSAPLPFMIFLRLLIFQQLIFPLALFHGTALPLPLRLSHYSNPAFLPFLQQLHSLRQHLSRDLSVLRP